MPHRKMDDFKRGINALARQNGWHVDHKVKGRTERIVVYEKQGGKNKRITTFTLRTDQKEIGPGLINDIRRKLRLRVDYELDGDNEGTEPVTDAIEKIIEWISVWF